MCRDSRLANTSCALCQLPFSWRPTTPTRLGQLNVLQWQMHDESDFWPIHDATIARMCRSHANADTIKVIKANPEKQNNLREKKPADCMMLMLFINCNVSFSVLVRFALVRFTVPHSLETHSLCPFVTHVYIGAAMPCAHNYMIRKLIRFNILGATIHFFLRFSFQTENRKYFAAASSRGLGSR